MNGLRKSNSISKAVAATIMAQLGRSPELTRLLILLIIWGQVRFRTGYTMVDEQKPAVPDQSHVSVPKGRGFSVKRPRARFL